MKESKNDSKKEENVESMSVMVHEVLFVVSHNIKKNGCYIFVIPITCVHIEVGFNLTNL